MPEMLLNEAPVTRVLLGVRDWIATGRLAAGAVLPSERAVAEQFGVTRRAARRAIDVLIAEGLIRVQSARIRTVADRKPDVPPPASTSWMQNAIVVLGVTGAAGALDPSALPYADALWHGALDETARLALETFTVRPTQTKEGILKYFTDVLPKGVIVPELMWELESAAIAAARELKSRGVAAVAYGSGPEVEGLDRVTSDHEQGAYELTRWLIAHGRHRVGMLWTHNMACAYWYPARRAGYERAMAEAGLSPTPTLYSAATPDKTPENAEAFMIEARKHVGFLIEPFRGPHSLDALLCASDSVVHLIAAALRICGKEAGRDVLLAGYDAFAPTMRENTYFPGIPHVTIDKRYWTMGQELTRLLQDRLTQRLPAEPQVRVVPPKLIVLNDWHG